MTHNGASQFSGTWADSPAPILIDNPRRRWSLHTCLAFEFNGN